MARPFCSEWRSIALLCSQQQERPDHRGQPHLPALDACGSVPCTIVSAAFGLGEAAAGITGGLAAALLNGAKRGLFSDEAGMGSALNAAATATTSHPVKQGLIQSLGVFVDTIIVCSATAFIILFTGSAVYRPGETTEGASLTQAAVAHELGSGTTWM